MNRQKGILSKLFSIEEGFTLEEVMDKWHISEECAIIVLMLRGKNIKVRKYTLK